MAYLVGLDPTVSRFDSGGAHQIKKEGVMNYTYVIDIPFSGKLSVEVTKERDDLTAEELYMDGEVQNILDDVRIDAPEHVVDIEWEPMTKITEGNVFLGVLNDIEVVAVDEEDE